MGVGQFRADFQFLTESCGIASWPNAAQESQICCYCGDLKINDEHKLETDQDLGVHSTGALIFATAYARVQ